MSSFNLSLSPTQSEYVLKPGITIIQAYDVYNHSDSNITLNTEVLPWLPSGTDGSVNYKQAIHNPYIEFSLVNSDLTIGRPFTLAPNSKQQIVLKVKTHPNIKLSDNYYTFFVFQNQNIINSNDNFSQATGRIGSHLLLSVSDIENPKVESTIQNFSISPKIKDIFFRPITFSGKIKNNSNFFFKTEGKITILKNDNIIKQLDLDPKNVLNQHSRDFSCQENICSLNPPLWPGHYKLKMELESSLNTIPHETSFYVFPLSPLIFIILTLGLIFGIKKLKKKKKTIQ